jgi:hypothetical protein
MRDVTAGRSLGTVRNAEFDPTQARLRRGGQPHESAQSAGVIDVLAGRSAGTLWNTAQDPTRPAVVDDPRR